MPKLIPMPVIVDLLDDGPVIKLVIEYKKGKRGKLDRVGCHKCIGRGREDCSSIREAAKVRGEKLCLDRDSAYYVLRPLKKSEVR